jgi:hypothetical protein
VRAIAAAHASDFATFALAISVAGVPIAAESNPLMSGAYLVGGLAMVALLKTSLTTIILYAVQRIRTKPRKGPVLWGYTLGLVGMASNVVAIVRFA